MKRFHSILCKILILVIIASPMQSLSASIVTDVMAMSKLSMVYDNSNESENQSTIAASIDCPHCESSDCTSHNTCAVSMCYLTAVLSTCSNSHFILNNSIIVSLPYAQPQSAFLNTLYRPPQP